MPRRGHNIGRRPMIWRYQNNGDETGLRSTGKS
nr:MAG TPA: hypothetical protein [Caudoviricetes sp.]